MLYSGVAKLLEDKRIRGFGGVSFPLVGRVRGGVGLAVPIEVNVVVDEGGLTVTSQRVVFTGGKKTKTLKGKSLVAAQAENDLVVIRPANGRLVVYRSGDAGAAAGAIQSLIELSM